MLNRLINTSGKKGAEAVIHKTYGGIDLVIHDDYKITFSQVDDPHTWSAPRYQRTLSPAWFWFPLLRIVAKVFRLKWDFYKWAIPVPKLIQKYKRRILEKELRR